MDGVKIENLEKLAKVRIPSIVMDGVKIEKLEKFATRENSKSIVMDGDNIEKVGKVCNKKKFQEHRDGWRQH